MLEFFKKRLQIPKVRRYQKYICLTIAIWFVGWYFGWLMHDLHDWLDGITETSNEIQTPEKGEIPKKGEIPEKDAK